MREERAGDAAADSEPCCARGGEEGVGRPISRGAEAIVCAGIWGAEVVEMVGVVLLEVGAGFVGVFSDDASFRLPKPKNRRLLSFLPSFSFSFNDAWGVASLSVAC